MIPKIINAEKHDYTMNDEALRKKINKLRRQLFELQEQGYTIQYNLNGETCGEDNWKTMVIGMDEVYVDAEYRWI